MASVRRIVPWLVVLAVLASGVVLGVLQVRWVGEASRAEESRIRATLNRGAEQVRYHAEDEVRVLLSLARVPSAAIASGDLDDVTDSLQLWQANTRFPRLLRNLYLVRQLPDGGVLAWSSAEERFVDAELPADVAEAAGAALVQAQTPGSWPTATLPGWRRVVVVPVYGARGTRSTLAPTAAAVIDLDASVFYAEVVPFYMKRNLAEFPWRIVDAADGSVIGASEGLAADRQPEAVVGLRSLAVDEPGRARGAASEPDSGILLDPLLQSWLQRAQGEGEAAVRPPELPLPEATEAKLEVYYPGGTLAGTVRTRQVLSLAVSLGLVGMLLASVGVLTRLYRRSARLRASEQEFVASVSHELRTPIAVIQATSQNLLSGAVSDPARLPRYAEVIHGQVKRLAGMVESILLYAGLESGMARQAFTGRSRPAEARRGRDAAAAAPGRRARLPAVGGGVGDPRRGVHRPDRAAARRREPRRQRHPPRGIDRGAARAAAPALRHAGDHGGRRRVAAYRRGNRPGSSSRSCAASAASGSSARAAAWACTWCAGWSDCSGAG